MVAIGQKSVFKQQLNNLFNSSECILFYFNALDMEFTKTKNYLAKMHSQNAK